MPNENAILKRLETLNAIGVALSSERDIGSLLERILEAARDFAHADGGTLYRLEDRQLIFEVLRNDTLGLVLGGKHGQPIDIAPLQLYAPDGSGNDTTVVAHAALSGKTVNIPDAYAAEGFDFSGTRAFDQSSGYRSQSFLTVPMKDHSGVVIGVLQLINAKRADGPDERGRSLRTQDRRPVARLRQDHHASARGRQGHETRDIVRPHRAGRHPLRGAAARRRDRPPQG